MARLMSIIAVLTALKSPRVAAFAPSASIGLRSLFVSGSTPSSPNLCYKKGSRAAFVPPIKNGLRMMFGMNQRKEIDYQSLSGAALEAATYALEGEVPSVTQNGLQIATFAGGCFWGLELAMQRVPGVDGTSVGYTQGDLDKPTYGEVCSGSTGHTEAMQVFYNEKEVSFTTLCEVFFGRIDASQVNGQGGDRGTQYRTGVYYHTDKQKEEADAVFKSVASSERYQSTSIATELMPAKVYWPAEDYHQQYLEKGGRFGTPQSAEKGATDTIRCYG